MRPFSLQRSVTCAIGPALLSSTSYATDPVTAAAKAAGAILGVGILVYLVAGIIILGWWFLAEFITKNRLLRALLRAVPVAIFGAAWFGPSSPTYSGFFDSFMTLYFPTAFVAAFVIGNIGVHRDKD